MPDRVKEKLVELLENSFANQYEKRGLLTAPHTATDLIANGVTVQEWIPVTERLPEMKDDVLLHFPIEKNMAVGFLCDVDEDKTMWCAYTDDGYYTDCDFEPAHWMPLPQPPKGE
jgi:hypothetical protein